MKHSLLLLFFFQILLASCTQKKIVQADEQNGGIDSSGGDPIVSTEDEVRAALKDIHTLSSEALFRLSLEFMLLSKETINSLYGEGSFQALKEFFEAKNFASDRVFKKIINQEIALDVKENSSCVGDNSHHTASARGSFPGGEICFSIPSLRTLPSETLREQVAGLYLHEIGHLFGLEEESAQKIQSIILKGRRYLVPLKGEADEFIGYADRISSLILHSNILKDPSDYTHCGQVNRAVSLTERLEAIAASSQNIDLNRRLPEYITLDLFTLSEMTKGLRGYCSDYPLSRTAHYNVRPGDELDLQKKVDTLRQQASMVLERLKIYLRPSTDIDGVAIRLRQFDDFVVIGGNTISDIPGNEGIPRECFLRPLDPNFTFFPPKDGPVILAGQTWCSLTVDQQYRYYSPYYYWSPGKKMLGRERRAIEKRFLDEILVLKVQKKLSVVMSYLVQSVDEEKFGFMASLLKSFAWIDDSLDTSEAPKILKDIVIRVLISLQAANDDSALSSSPRESYRMRMILYYGLTKAKEFGLFQKDISTYTSELLKALQVPGGFERRYRLLSNKWDQLEIPLF